MTAEGVTRPDDRPADDAISGCLSAALDALALVGTDASAALGAADHVLARCVTASDDAARVTAHRAAGLALRYLGRLPEAVIRLRAAVRGTDSAAVAEARMSLAWVLLESGDTRAAQAQADRAATALSGLPAARLLVQHAMVLQRCGRDDEALTAFSKALPALRKHADHSWEARLRNNRGLLYAYRGATGQAETDLQRARALFDQLGEDLHVADTDGNLAFVAARRGDVPTALRLYDAADRVYAAHRAPIPSLLLDRANVLLAVGLSHEARVDAGRAVEQLRSAAMGADLGEGLVTVAQAALAEGDSHAAAIAAAEAETHLRRQQRPSWVLLARFAGLQAQAMATDDPSVSEQRRISTRAMRLADALAAAGWRAEEADALLIAARAALAGGRQAAAREILYRARRARTSGSVAVRTRAWHAEALLRSHRGDRAGALRATDAGLDALDEHRALLGASELRAQLSVHGRDLADLALRVSVEGGRATSVFRQAERWRACALRLARVRPPDEPGLAGALAELRQVTADLDTARLDGDGASRALDVRRGSLERRVRALSRHADAGRPNVVRPPTASEIANALDNRALVEFVAIGDRVHAVTIVDTRVRLKELCALVDVRLEVETLHFHLSHIARRGENPGAFALLKAAADRLDAMLLRPLRELDLRPLVISPTGPMQALPWAVLPSCASRPVTVAPSATSWLRAERTLGAAIGGGALFAAGPGLPAAESEVVALAGLRSDATVLTGSDATTARVLHAMDGAELAHLAAHGRLRRDNSAFSALDLADGPLTVYDVEELRRPPAHVVLSACRSAVGVVQAGDEVTGLASALLALGTRAVVAAVVPVPDGLTPDFMLDLHLQLEQRERPSTALAKAIALQEPGTAGWATGVSFICLGAG
jgi:tetratricopeptide (TPR) repeat protein